MYGYKSSLNLFQCLSDWNKFKLLKKAVVKELRRAKAAYFADIGHTVSGNPREGWSLLNSVVRPKQKDHIGSIVSPSGESITNPADIVNSFNDHFSALYNSLPPARYRCT